MDQEAMARDDPRPWAEILADVMDAMESVSIVRDRMHRVQAELSERLCDGRPASLDGEAARSLRKIREMSGGFDEMVEAMQFDAYAVSASVESIYPLLNTAEDNSRMLEKNGYSAGPDCPWLFTDVETLESGVVLRRSVKLADDGSVQGRLGVSDSDGTELFSTDTDGTHDCRHVVFVLEEMSKPWRSGWVDVSAWRRGASDSVSRGVKKGNGDDRV